MGWKSDCNGSERKWEARIRKQTQNTPSRKGRLWEKRLCSCQSWAGASGESHQRESRLEGKASRVAGGGEKGHWRAGWSGDSTGSDCLLEAAVPGTEGICQQAQRVPTGELGEKALTVIFSVAIQNSLYLELPENKAPPHLFGGLVLDYSEY